MGINDYYGDPPDDPKAGFDDLLSELLQEMTQAGFTLPETVALVCEIMPDHIAEFHAEMRAEYEYEAALENFSE